MKILYALDYNEGGSYNVATPLAHELRDYHNDEVTFMYKDNPLPLTELYKFDVAHAWNMRAGLCLPDSMPIVQTINSFRPEHAKPYIEAAKRASVVHSHSPYVCQFLYNFADGLPVSFIPNTFDHSRCEPLPLPPTFTLGWLGSNNSFKNFERAREIADAAGVPYIEWNVDVLHPWQKVRDEFYPNISCYLVASMNDAMPLPPQEALLFGRPVITTPVGAMNMVVQDGLNGRFFNGSLEDGVSIVKSVERGLTWYSEHAATTKLPDANRLIYQYRHLYELALEG